jgi:tRNA-splicing ligase RtcB/release factor H-coupled RctB family protein
MKTHYFTGDSEIEENALTALQRFEAQDNIQQIAVFPDIHYCSEKSIPIGVAFKTEKVFYPLVTGQDMGCGVAYRQIKKEDCLKPFDKTKHYRAFEKASREMTDEGLGGGNHFLSIEESEKFLYVFVHTGSRNLGLLQENNPGQEWLPIEFATDEYIANYQRVLDYAKDRREQFLDKSVDFLIKNGYVKNWSVNDWGDSHHNSLDFTENGVIHRKGSTQLINDGLVNNVVIPLSMSRGSLIVKLNRWDELNSNRSLQSSSHGAGRKYSRTDTLKYWHSMKKSARDSYEKRFPELLNRSGKFDSSLIQEFDFAYKNSEEILKSQPHLIKIDETQPIVTFKFTGI